jgi:hypothetical protein
MNEIDGDGKDENERRRAALWRTWKLYRRGSSAHTWWKRLAYFFKTKAGIAAAVAITGGAATVGAIVVKDRMAPPPVETAALSAPEAAERTTRTSTVFAIEGVDKAGKRGSFDVVVLNKSFLWVRGSAEELEKDGKTIPAAELAAAVLDEEVRGALSDAKEVIAVGTASQEGSATEEVDRAQRRARQAATLVTGAVAGTVPISILNLGQYRDPCTNCETSGTSWQRPFIVIAVKQLEPGTHVGEALADAMSGKKRLPSPSSYSTFALSRFR